MTPARRAPTVRRAATDEETKALASTVRLRILRVCLGENHTNKEIAEALGKDPATTLHHVRRLVATGFLRALPPRRGTRGSREIPYVATGKSWRISSPARDRTSLQALLEEIELVPAEQVDSARLGLRLSPDDMADFRGRLRELLDDFAGRPDDPAAPAWSMYMVIHPDPNRP